MNTVNIVDSLRAIIQLNHLQVYQGIVMKTKRFPWGDTEDPERRVIGSINRECRVASAFVYRKMVNIAKNPTWTTCVHQQPICTTGRELTPTGEKRRVSKEFKRWHNKLNTIYIDSNNEFASKNNVFLRFCCYMFPL